MIFTDRFVYVHQPKTGGTFVTSVLFRLHDFRWTRWTHLQSAFRGSLVHRNRYGTFVYNNHKHGGRAAIPAAQRHKPVLATARNPYDLYVSQYEFGWWKRREYRRWFRPDLSFEEYVRVAGEAFGPLAQQFLRFHDGRVDDVRFVTTDRLNEGLHDFLAETGYAAEDIAFVRELPKILPKGKGRHSEQTWEKFYTPELKQLVRTREHDLFTLFPQFDV
ncbi:MAG TPA: hypothetical protein VEK57_02770 [Thermoanaerobaculia bacterium]|nr:hypothetical protein [Thermoanaerobaculia bacterium]